MAFKRRETVIEAVDLNGISPEDAEKRIISGVKKYATNEGNWAAADPGTLAALRSEEAELKTRLRMSGAKLRVSEEVAREASRRSPVEESKVSEVRRLLAETLAQAERVS